MDSLERKGIRIPKKESFFSPVSLFPFAKDSFFNLLFTFTMSSLHGDWTSTQAYGTTSLDWSSLLKNEKAILKLSFKLDSTYTFDILQEGKIITQRLLHTPPFTGSYTVNDDRIILSGILEFCIWNILFYLRICLYIV